MASNSKNIAELLNGDVTVTATDIADGSVTAAKIANDAVVTAKIPDDAITEAKIQSGAVESAMTTQIGGRRNLIINGAMQVAQRSTSATGVNSDGYNTVDRFQILCRGGVEYTQSQSTDAPDGFGYSLKFECTTADASPVGNDRTFLQHLMEGQNVQVFGKGTSSPKNATVSFWVKSSETGGLQVNLVDDSNNAQIHSSVTINQANTWEHKTVTYSMDHSGYEIDNDNARRFWVEWIISRGSDYTGGSMETSWTIAPAANTRGAGTTINSAATVGTTFQITGVQLEVGDTATPFEHRSYGEELLLCQRYFHIIEAGSGGRANIVNGSGFNGSSFYGIFNHPIEMRTSPSCSVDFSNNDIIVYGNDSANSAVSGDVVFERIERNALRFRVNNLSLTQGRSYWAELNNTANYKAIKFDAEL